MYVQKKVLHVIQALLKLPLVFTTQTRLKFKFNTVRVSDTCVVLFSSEQMLLHKRSTTDGLRLKVNIQHIKATGSSKLLCVCVLKVDPGGKQLMSDFKCQILAGDHLYFSCV